MTSQTLLLWRHKRYYYNVANANTMTSLTPLLWRHKRYYYDVANATTMTSQMLIIWCHKPKRKRVASMLEKQVNWFGDTTSDFVPRTPMYMMEVSPRAMTPPMGAGTGIRISALWSTSTYMHTYIYTYIETYITHTYIYVYIYIHIHIHIYIYIYIYVYRGIHT